MTTHTMKLADAPYDMFMDGRKTAEARLYDDKRQKIALSDTITFRRQSDTSQSFDAVVVGLMRFETFGDMFAHVGAGQFGGDNPEQATAAMLTYYSQEQQDRSGVIGIVVELIR